jgi:hypothetical protein
MTIIPANGEDDFNEEDNSDSVVLHKPSMPDNEVERQYLAESVHGQVVGDNMTVHQYFSAAVGEVARADVGNIQEVAASQLSIVNSYYQGGLLQSQQSFRWSLIWGGIGLAFLIVTVGVLLFRQPTEVAVASGIAGAFVEVFAGTYLYLYKHASDQLAGFRVSLESTQRLLLANSMCEGLEGEARETARAKLIERMSNSDLLREATQICKN